MYKILHVLSGEYLVFTDRANRKEAASKSATVSSVEEFTTFSHTYSLYCAGFNSDRDFLKTSKNHIFTCKYKEIANLAIAFTIRELTEIDHDNAMLSEFEIIKI